MELKSIQLLNFKGVRQAIYDFYHLTEVKGDNGTGKSTLYDAFCWLLTGKDSMGRKQFSVKTINKDGDVIPKLDHEVKAVIDVDGKNIVLARTLTEKWTRKRGEVSETLTGNNEERWIDGVKMSEKDWAVKIGELCVSDNLLPFVTDVFAVGKAKTETLRELLSSMIDQVSTEEILSSVQGCEQLAEELKRTSFAELKTRIATKSKSLKKEIEQIPALIEERRKDIQNVDYSAVEKSLKEKQAMLAEIDKQRSSIEEAMKGSNAEEQKRQEAILKQRINLMSLERQLEEIKFSSENETEKERNRLNSQIEAKESHNVMLQTEAFNKKQEIEKVREKWREEQAKQCVFTDEQFVCPTCGRAYEMSEVQSMREQILEQFKQTKAEHLKTLSETGHALKARLEQVDKEIASTDAELTTLRKQLTELKPKDRSAEENDVKKQIEAVSKTIKDLEGKLPTQTNSDDKTAELKRNYDNLQSEIIDLSVTLKSKEQNEQNKKRVAELEQELTQKSCELASCEAIEYQMSLFSKSRSQVIEQKVNEQFKMLQFKMFDTLLNGAEVEVCIPTYKGVPYSDLNTASKINCGIDFVRAVSKKFGVNMPLFVDNAESVSVMEVPLGQMIRLKVTNDDTLTVSEL